MRKKTPLRAKTTLKAKKPLRASEKPQKRKTPVITTLRRKADRVFSRYVRIRDSEWRDDGWYGKCITCTKEGLVAYFDDTGKLRFVRGWDAGHYISRGNKYLRYDEENVNLQCLTKESNVNMYGNYTRSIKDVVAGDAVIAFDETTHKKTVATVVQNVPLVSEELYEVELENGTTFKGTGDHRVLCEIDGNREWVFLRDINNMLHTGTVCNIITL